MNEKKPKYRNYRFNEPSKKIGFSVPISMLAKIPRGVTARKYFFSLLQLDPDNNRYIEIMSKEQKDSILVVLDLFRNACEIDGFVELLNTYHEKAITILEEVVKYYKFNKQEDFS